MAQEILFGSLGLGIIVLGVFIALSMDQLGFNQVGLNYSSYFKSIENRTYTAGFHFIGLGHDFVPYDLTIQTMEFSNDKGATLPPISCRTKDGLKLELEFSFQYRVLSKDIYKIYTTYANEMKNVLLRMAIDAISDTATEYSSYDFFTKRSVITDVMSSDLNERLKRDVSCEVVFFQLRSINLPDAYENAIEETEVTKQGILQAEAVRNKNKIIQDTNVEQAFISKNITINQAIAVAESKKLKAEAQANTFMNITQSQAEAYALLKQNLTFTNQDLIKYLQVNLVKDQPNGNLVISLKDQK